MIERLDVQSGKPHHFKAVRKDVWINFVDRMTERCLSARMHTPDIHFVSNTGLDNLVI